LLMEVKVRQAPSEDAGGPSMYSVAEPFLNLQ